YLSRLQLALVFVMIPRPPCSPLFPYTTLFRSVVGDGADVFAVVPAALAFCMCRRRGFDALFGFRRDALQRCIGSDHHEAQVFARSEEHTSELQSRENLVCRLLPEKKKRPIQST